MKLGDVQKRLQKRYLDSLPEKITVIKQGLEAVRDNDPTGETSLRRLAHQISGSAGSFGYPVLGKAAKRVENAPADEICDRTQELLAELQKIHSAEPQRTARILVVDDDVDITAAIEETLASPTRRVQCAGSICQAEEMMASASWDLVFLDLMLPDGDGRELLLNMRGNARTRDLPVIVLSGKHNSLVKNECAAYDVEVFLEKPIDKKVLSTVVDASIRRHRTFHSEAYQDDLTGLSNRPGFRLALTPLVALCERNKHEISIAILDLDHFKRFNDEYGHATGDAALKMFAETLKSGLRKSDLVGRWGGEEFIVALPETDAVQGTLALTKIADKLRQKTVAPDVQEKITFSAGVTSLGESEWLDRALLRADKRLYAAKEQGRDRILHEIPDGPIVRPKLLLVEDDLDMAAILSADLSEEYDVTHVDHGATALSSIENNSFEVVILDHELPDLTGVQVAEAITAMPSSLTPQIVFLTSSTSETVLEEAFSAGAVDYVVKPYRKRELLARIARLFSGRG